MRSIFAAIGLAIFASCGLSAPAYAIVNVAPQDETKAEACLAGPNSLAKMMSDLKEAVDAIPDTSGVAIYGDEAVSAEVRLFESIGVEYIQFPEPALMIAGLGSGVLVVTFDKDGCYIGQTPITRSQWEAISDGLKVETIFRNTQ